jgi:hypothetical protein
MNERDETKPVADGGSDTGGGGPTMTEADIAEKGDPVGHPSGEGAETAERNEDRPHLGSAGSGGQAEEDPGAGGD